jgi:formylmethanofuran dehydrogenase subunit E
MWTVAYHYNGRFCGYLNMGWTLQEACKQVAEFNRRAGENCYVVVPYIFCVVEL